MTQYAIAVDVNRCVACMACNGACKMVNNVPIGSFWNKVLRIGPQEAAEGGAKPARDFYYLPIQCQHCENPACVAVCPTEASHKLPDGTIQIDKSKCIGCQFCAMACPYGIPGFGEDGKMQKCDACIERQKAGLKPACVKVCPTGALTLLTEEEFKARGVNVVIYANQLTRAGFPAMQNAAKTILERHRAQECDEICMPIQDIITLIPEEV